MLQGSEPEDMSHGIKDLSSSDDSYVSEDKLNVQSVMRLIFQKLAFHPSQEIA